MLLKNSKGLPRNRNQEKIDVLRCHLQMFNLKNKNLSRYSTNQLPVTHVRLFTNKTYGTPQFNGVGSKSWLSDN